MTTVIINAGIGKSRHNSELDTTMVMYAVDKIRHYLALTAGGFTETETMGGWIDGEGRLVQERGKQWTVAGYDMERGKDAARYIGKALNQDTVMVSYYQTETAFQQVQYETAKV